MIAVRRFFSSKTRVSGTALALVGLLEQAGLLTLDEQTLSNLVTMILGGALVFLRNAVDKVSPSTSPARRQPPPPAPRLGLYGLVALVAVLLVATGCYPALDAAQRWLGGETPPLVLEDVHATVTSDVHDLAGTESSLSGKAFMVKVRGLQIAAVCVGSLESRCAGFEVAESIHLERAYWRQGRLKVGRKEVTGPYLHLDKCRSRFD
ncbi:MAG: hypothetical protein AAGD06_22465 [Acidobacteriota bacterium]